MNHLNNSEAAVSLEKQNALKQLKRPTCQLFTRYIGCGKSTELHRLEAELMEEGCHVVYCDSEQYLNMGDVNVTDILLAIALWGDIGKHKIKFQSWKSNLLM